MANIKISRKGKRLVENLDIAAQNKAFKGAAHPDDRDSIENDYVNAKFTLLTYISELENKA